MVVPLMPKGRHAPGSWRPQAIAFQLVLLFIHLFV